MAAIADTPIVPLTMFSRGAPFYASRYVISGDIPRHQLDHAEIVIITDGLGRMSTYPAKGGPRTYRLRPGRIMLMRPSDRFRYSAADPRGVTTRYVSFPYADWQNFAALVGVPPSSTSTIAPPMVTVDPDDDIIRPFELALERFEPRSPPRRRFPLRPERDRPHPDPDGIGALRA